MPRNVKPTRIKYTPAQIAQLSDKTVRQRYAQLRSIALKRIARLKAAGFGDTDLADVNLPASGKLSAEDLRAGLADLSRWLRDPRTTVRGMKQYLKRMKESLQQAGYNIPARDLAKFGRYMEEMRARYKGRLPGSDLVAGVYDHAARLGVSGNTLQRNFRQWLDDDEKIAKLYKKLQEIQLPPGRKRLSSKELKKLLEKNDL